MTREERRRSRERDGLVERVVSAARRRAPDGRILPPPEFFDLSPAGREQAYFEQILARALEAAWDERGLSTTGRLVVERAGRLAQLSPEHDDDGGD